MSGMNYIVAGDITLCVVGWGIVMVVAHWNGEGGGEMIDYDYLNGVIIRLKDAKDYAIKAGLDHHFVAEIDHLIVTAMANREDESK